MFSGSEEGMWGRCFAKCGSRFHLKELSRIYGEGKKLKGNENRFLFNIAPIRMPFLTQVLWAEASHFEYACS